MSDQALPRVLCVDDEPRVLDSLRRSLRNHFDVATADRPARALTKIQMEGPFDVVLSDLQMPTMNGIELLRRVGFSAPDTARVLLTGNADMHVAIDAINRGQLHRFLLKPCPRDDLIEALNDAVELHRRQVAERGVLDQTLRASVEALTDVLAMANPRVFARSKRITALIRGMIDTLNPPGAWEIEVAAMLSQIGAISLPDQLQETLHRGGRPSRDERAQVARVPERSAAVVAEIPRLQLVSECIRHQLRGFDGSGPPEDGPAGSAIPLGARMLRIAADFDTLLSNGFGAADAHQMLRGTAQLYDPDLLDSVTDHAETSLRIQQRSLSAVPEDSIVAADVRDPDGMLLVGTGQRATAALLDRLRNLARTGQAPPEMWVRCE